MSASELIIEKIKLLGPNEQQQVLEYVDSLASSHGSVLDRFADYVKDMEQYSTQLPEDLSVNHDHYLHGQSKRL